MPTSKKSSAVKKAWAEANKLHKTIQSEGMDTFQSRKSTPGLARRYNSLMKKGLVPKQRGIKNKIEAYGEWLAKQQPRQKPVEVDEFGQPVVSSKETTSPTKGAAIPPTAVEVVDFKVLENLSQTCRQFQITPNELVAHVNILEQLQVLDTTCVQDAG
jgi:hypothetical protein